MDCKTTATKRTPGGGGGGGGWGGGLGGGNDQLTQRNTPVAKSFKSPKRSRPLLCEDTGPDQTNLVRVKTGLGRAGGLLTMNVACGVGTQECCVFVERN